MDKDILKQLYQKYRKGIYLYLYSLCKNESLAEDLLQETFLKALLSLSDGHANMWAWLYMVARNLFFNDYHKEKVPLENVAQMQNTGNITTSRISLDLSVYSELFWPGSYRNTANAIPEGYGTYSISIPQVLSYGGKTTTVNGRLKRGKLTLYNTDVFKMPYGNTFAIPEEVEEYTKVRFYDTDGT